MYVLQVVLQVVLQCLCCVASLSRGMFVANQDICVAECCNVLQHLLHVCLYTRTFGYTSQDTVLRRCTGCLKLQVSFRKRATNYRALLCRKYAHLDACVRIYVYVHYGEHAWDALSCRSFSAKEPLNAGLFCNNDL